MDLYLPMGGPLTLLQSRQCALYVLLSLSILAMGWRPSPGGAPTGCEMVFAATTRGGATASVGGGGCNILRRSDNGRSKVVRVVDGDTIKVSGGRRVRYVGIDTPEVGEDPEATDFNRSLVGGRVVYLQRDVSDEDRFKRLLRFVYADGILVNAELVREGYARAKPESTEGHGGTA